MLKKRQEKFYSRFRPNSLWLSIWLQKRLIANKMLTMLAKNPHIIIACIKCVILIESNKSLFKWTNERTEGRRDGHLLANEFEVGLKTQRIQIRLFAGTLMLIIWLLRFKSVQYHFRHFVSVANIMTKSVHASVKHIKHKIMRRRRKTFVKLLLEGHL